MGLLTEHAYSVLQVRVVPHGVQGGAGGERLLQLRNPWGKLFPSYPPFLRLLQLRNPGGDVSGRV